MSSNKGYCYLKQSEFGANCVSGFQELRTAGEFLDVTLACEDESVDVHKLVLSANSAFFRRILNKKNDPHAYIYIKGLAFPDLLAIINFMYQGETKVPGDNLSRFLQAAQDLDIRGLGADQIKGTAQNKTLMTNNSTKSLSSDSSRLNSGSSSELRNGTFKRSCSSKKTLDVVKEVDEKKEEDLALYEIVDQNAMNCSFGSELSKISQKMNKMKQVKIDSIQRIKSTLNDNYNPNDTLDSVLPNAEECVEDTFEEEMVEDEAEAEVSSDSAMIIDGSASSDQNAQLELEISLRMAKIRDSSNFMLWKCKVCGKIAKRKEKLGYHIESHLNGFIHKCGICRKSFKTRHSLQVHQKYIHKKYKK